MGHGGVRHSVTERDVQLGQPPSSLRQEAESDITDIITRSQVELLQPAQAGEGLEPGVGDADAEAQVNLVDGWKPLRNVFQGFVCEFLTILETDSLESLGAGAGLTLESCEMTDPVVRYLPARSQVQRLYLLQSPGDQQEAGVGDLGAAAQVQPLQVLAVRGDPAQAAVGHVLAEAEIENLEAHDVLVESCIEGGV